MIPNHKQFIQAIQEKKKVNLRFYSRADSGVIDLVCAPMDYRPASEFQDGVNRYHLWDYSSNNGSHFLVLLPEQILNLSLLGLVFEPGEFGVPPSSWSIPREWGAPSAPAISAPSAGATQTQTQPGSLVV